MLDKDKEIQYALFETGNDEPWEEDLIEFEENEKVVIHRGSCSGLYKYRYNGIIVDTEVDAVDLVAFGMAKKAQIEICAPWAESGIKFADSAFVLRDIINYTLDSVDGDYIIEEDNKYYSVNKFYLLTKNLAKLDGDKLMDEVPLKRMNYKGDDNPWKEDKIFFLSNNVKKGREPGWYKLRIGSVTVNRTTEQLLRDGLAMRLSERARYYFTDYCKDQSKRREFSTTALTDFFKNVLFFDTEYIVKDSFRIDSLYDFVICYVAFKKNTVASSKTSQLEIFVPTQEIIQKFQSAINQFALLLDKCQQKKSVCLKRLDELQKKLDNLETSYSTLINSPDFSVWTGISSSKQCRSYKDFYLRSVKNFGTWDATVSQASQLETALNKALQILNRYYNEDIKDINVLKNREPILNLERGLKQDMEILNRKKNAFKENALFTQVVDSYNLINAKFNAFRQKASLHINLIKEDNAKITEKRKLFDKIKETVKKTTGSNSVSKFMLAIKRKYKPWSSNIKFVRKDFLIERVNYGKIIAENSKDWSLFNCYLLTLSAGESVYVFDDALLYLGLAVKK